MKDTLKVKIQKKIQFNDFVDADIRQVQCYVFVCGKPGHN